MTEDFNLPESVALDVARLIDYHDQPSTVRARRLVVQARLRDIFDAPTTATLSRARIVRKWCVAAGIYERPETAHRAPAYLFKPDRPIKKWESRTHT